ncbi:MAG: hypothetical protein WCA77_09490 [Thermoplasmata archaeon]
MYGRPSERRFTITSASVRARTDARRPWARIVLPSPVSAAHALSVVILGFAVEGATEAYQFLQRGSLGQGWFEYYTTLATTLLGFYFMFLGLREWRAFFPKPKRRRTVPWRLVQLFANATLSIGMWVGRHSKRVRQKRFLPWALAMIGATVGMVVAAVMIDRPKAPPPRRPFPWVIVGLFLAGTASTALLSLALGGVGTGPTPFWLAWPVGGLVVLLIGNFFFGLRKMAAPFGSSLGKGLGWGSFGWSAGVGVVSGLVVGDRAVQLLVEFFTSWGALIASIAPIVVAISPLFVAYALMAGTFWDAHREFRGRSTHSVTPE